MAVIGEHPIARWLDVQLPQLVNQYVTNRDNRIHEKDMLKARQKNQREMALFQNDLSNERQLNNWNLDQHTKAYDAKVKSIEDKQNILQSFEIDATKISGLNQTQQTDAGVALIKGIGEEFARPLIQDIEAKNTMEGQFDELASKSDYLDETEAILDRLLMGATEGTRIGNLVGDLDPTGIEGQINKDDFVKYLDLMENPYEEGTPEYKGFMAQVPSYEEGLKLGEQYWNTINSQAKAQTNIAKGQGIAPGMNYESFNAVLDFGSKGFGMLDPKLLDEDYSAAVGLDLSKFKFDQKTLENKPHLIYDAMDNLAGGIVGAIKYSDSTSSALAFAKNYEAAKSDQERFAVMKGMLKDFREKGSETQIALDTMFGSDDKDNPHQIHFNKMLDFYDKLLREENMAGVLSGKYSIDVLNEEVSKEKEGDPDIKVPTEEVEKLNQDLTNAQTSSQRVSIAVNKALEAGSEYPDDPKSAHLMAQDQIYSLINNGVLSDTEGDIALKELDNQRSSQIIASSDRMSPLYDLLSDVGSGLASAGKWAMKRPYERTSFRKGSGELDELQETLLASTE